MKKFIAMLVGVLFMFVASAAMAEFKPAKMPDAPAEYQKMKNKFKTKKKAVKEGEKWYKRKCKKCHGMKGDGKGSAAEDGDYAPTVFNKAGYLKGRSDGQLFFITKNGSEGTDMEAFGEGSDTNISDENIWKIISFMRKNFTK
jgi:cytochrome c